jgi:uracil phosphoribosyltransferase
VAQRVVVVDHPVLADRLSVMRSIDTPHGQFRQALLDASAILAVEATRELPVVEVDVQTPLEPTTGSRLPPEIAIVPVLRAGLAMVEGFLRLLPDVRVGHLGMQRDEEELTPRDYYERLPDSLPEAYVYLLDPMLATGGSAIHALDRLREAGAKRLSVICLVAAPEGLRAVEEVHGDVPIWTAAIDRQLDERGYIRPGLGDAGDRVFGTL